jgi:hypothetical protein
MHEALGSFSSTKINKQMLATRKRGQKQPRCPTTDDWIKKCGIYIQWNFIQPQRRMKFCHLQVNG